MDAADEIGAREGQQVVGAVEVAGVVAEALAPERALVEPLALDHRPHGAVEHEDAAVQVGEDRVLHGRRVYA